mgnify:CR=1 FL=1
MAPCIFVAGHRGLVGSALCRRLAADGIEPRFNVTYRETQPGRLFRAYSVRMAQNSEWNWGGDRQAASVTSTGNVTWHNFWTSSVSVKPWRRTRASGWRSDLPARAMSCCGPCTSADVPGPGRTSSVRSTRSVVSAPRVGAKTAAAIRQKAAGVNRPAAAGELPYWVLALAVYNLAMGLLVHLYMAARVVHRMGWWRLWPAGWVSPRKWEL